MTDPEATIEVDETAYRDQVTHRRRVITGGLLILFAVVPLLSYAVIELLS